LSGDVFHRRLLRSLAGARSGRPHRGGAAARRFFFRPPRVRPGPGHPGSLGQLCGRTDTRPPGRLAGAVPRASRATSATPRAAGLGLRVLAWPAARRQAPTAWRAAAALALAAVAIWLYTGTRLWVWLNGYTYRYLMPSALMVQTALVTVGVAPLCRAAGPLIRRGLNAAVVGAMFAGAALTFGLPSGSGVRADIDRKCGAM